MYNGSMDKLYSNLVKIKETPNQWHKVIQYNSSAGASVLLGNIKKGKVVIPDAWISKKGNYIFTARSSGDTSKLFAAYVPNPDYGS
jgi:hypothetical protein